jgi:uncharacterized membrane protein YccC
LRCTSTGISAPARYGASLRQASVTAGAAWLSFVTTQWFGLHEGYWAAISAVVVLQTDLPTTRQSGRDRLIGTAIGGVIGWGCSACWNGNLWVYAVAVGVAVFACWIARLEVAGRLSAVTVTVIVLIPRDEAMWKIALFRFLEVAWGIAVAVALASAVSWLLERPAAGPGDR